MKPLLVCLLLCLGPTVVHADMPVAKFQLPPRNAGAMTGSQFHDSLTSTTRDERENAVYRAVLSGNLPEFMRTFQPVEVNADINGTTHTAVYYITADYLCIGSDTDYYRIPTTPILAQWLANETHTTLPTRKMSNDIWKSSTCKLAPQPIPPDKFMALEPRFWEHQKLIQSARDAVTSQPIGTLVAGHKKDVVITMRLQETRHKSPRVFIYGWHMPNGNPIQPLSAAHEQTYVDYSHGTRHVAENMLLDGQTTKVQSVLKDPIFNVLLSDEGPFENIGLVYPTPPPPTKP